MQATKPAFIMPWKLLSSCLNNFLPRNATVPNVHKSSSTFTHTDGYKSLLQAYIAMRELGVAVLLLANSRNQ
jgi:hypothetical protein